MTRFALPAALLLVLVSSPADAQDRVWTRQVGPGWLGISYETTWIQRGERCEPRLLIDHVVQGSPAERAGLRPGDAIMAVGGQRLQPAGLQRLAARLAPGDSLSLRLHRDGRERKVVAVAGQRPDRVASLFVLRSRSGPGSTRAPIVEVHGDTLMARNLESTEEAGTVQGYWLSTGAGETEYRRLRSWRSGDELDRRVEALLSCAEQEGQRPIRVDLFRVQQRADSLRVRIAEGVLERQREENVRIRVGESGSLAVVGENESGDPVHTEELGPMSYVLRIEDHLMAGLRGLAGAEITALEPELAEYFDRVRDGLLVLRVGPGTLADRAGLRPGDVVVRANGRTVDSVAQLRALLARPDLDIELDLVRKGRSRTVTLRPR